MQFLSFPLMYIERAGGRWGGAEARKRLVLQHPESGPFFGPRARLGGASPTDGTLSRSMRPTVPFCPLPGPSSGRGLPPLCGPGLRLGPSSGCLRSRSPSGPGSLRPNVPSVPFGSFGPVRLRSFAPPFLWNGPPSFQPSDKRHAPKVVLLLRAWNPDTKQMSLDC